MKKALLLYGLNCTAAIWKSFLNNMQELETEILTYPHEITMSATEVMDLTKWVWSKVKGRHYDIIIAHSMGGVIALQLAAMGIDCQHLILIETNLRPANPFYRNLMTAEHMIEYDEIKLMLKQERAYASNELIASLQSEFDYTPLIHNLKQRIDIIYGDRNVPNYPERITDLCLDNQTIKMLNFHFITDSCHLPMIENPKGLAELIKMLII